MVRRNLALSPRRSPCKRHGRHSRPSTLSPAPSPEIANQSTSNRRPIAGGIMSHKLWLAAIALGAFTGAASLTAQEAPPPPSGNSEIIKMLSAGVPESTVLSEVELL